MWVGGKGRLGVMRTVCLRSGTWCCEKRQAVSENLGDPRRQELPSGGREASGQSRRGRGAQIQDPFVTCLMLYQPHYYVCVYV